MRAFLVFFLVFNVLLSGGISGNSQSKLTSIQKKIDANERQIVKKKKQNKEALYKLNKMSREIKYTQLKLKKTKDQLSVGIKKEKRAKRELAKMEKEFSVLQAAFSDRLLNLYKLSPLGIVELILSPNDLIVDSEVSYFVNKILDKDMELVKKMRREYAALEKKKALLREETTQILVLKRDIEDRESYLKRKTVKKEREMRLLKKEIAQLLQQNKDLEEMSRQLTQLILKEERSVGYYGTGSLIKPVKGWISSRFGMRNHPIFKRKIKHTGIDIAAPKGYRIRAADSGKVIFAGVKGGYGKSVLIYHGKRPKDGKSLSTFYAHQSRLLVKKGDFVKKGEEIGYVGATGYATGPHLHFEVKLAGRHVDPLPFISGG